MKIIRKVAFIYLMAMLVGMLVSLQPGPPGDGETPPETCVECEQYGEDTQEYYDCQAEFCGGLPIDNSIFYLFLAGTVLASYILLKKPNHKKTPM